MKSLSFHALLVAIAAALAFSASGCGGTAIDDVETAETIRDYLEKSLGEDVKSVDCPSGQPVEPKSTFDCEAVLAGGKRKTATVEIRNEDADFGVVEYKPKR